MQVQFKAKVQTVLNPDDSVAYRYVQVPTLTRKHVDMNAARSHPKYGSYANSDLFPSMLKRIAESRFSDTVWTKAGKCRVIRLDNVPEGVRVDTSGFLAVISWTE